jgi:hypothetical protein
MGKPESADAQEPQAYPRRSDGASADFGGAELLPIPAGQSGKTHALPAARPGCSLCGLVF